MKLQKMIHTAGDIYNDEGKDTIITHVVDCHMGGEYTVCGRAIPDSSLKYEGFEALGEEFEGTIRKCDCKDCRKRVAWFKKLK